MNSDKSAEAEQAASLLRASWDRLIGQLEEARDGIDSAEIRRMAPVFERFGWDAEEPAPPARMAANA